MSDTIFAVSSGAPPAAIAVLRISGPAAFTTGAVLAGTLPTPRRAGLRRLRAADGALLDTALVLAFPGPATATGEDLLELHLHGGRAVVRAIEAALASHSGLRAAEPGEFTRRALANGRIDLAQAEGLADLLAAETEAQRRAAQTATEGRISSAAQGWVTELVALSARTEALIDFADEDDVPAAPEAVATLLRDITALADAIGEALAAPPVERLRAGLRVVLAGPPNSGKSSLVNAMAEREVAIATPVPGTTRDRIEAPVLRGGVAYLLTDTAGLRDASDDPVETIGIARSRAAIAAADIVVWLGDDAAPDPAMIAITPRCDLPGRIGGRVLAVSALTGVGVTNLWDEIARRAAEMLPRPDAVAFNARHRAALGVAQQELAEIDRDLVMLAERLRRARVAVAAIYGGLAVENVLDDLFARFCIGK
ncbi:MAG: tRNA uridine-5-carboxymethylaminomethyl(34) synthesis GTPase MnmE [Pseudomonadota bacterium]